MVWARRARRRHSATGQVLGEMVARERRRWIRRSRVVIRVVADGCSVDLVVEVRVVAIEAA